MKQEMFEKNKCPSDAKVKRVANGMVLLCSDNLDIIEIEGNIFLCKVFIFSFLDSFLTLKTGISESGWFITM